MRKASLAIVVLLMCMSSGCMTIAKRGLGEVMGAKGEVLAVRPVSRATLASYRSVKLGTVTNEVGGLCPPQWVNALRTTVPAVLAKELGKEFPGGEPSLTVDLNVQYAQAGGTLSSIVAPEKLIIARMYVRGSDAGQLGELVLVTRSEATRADAAEMAEGAGQGIARYLKGKAGKSED